MTIPEGFYEEVLASSPSTETLLLVLSRLKEEGHGDRVIQECRRALSGAPEDMRIRRLLAETYFEQNRFDEAEGELKRVREGMDCMAGALKLQARLFLEQNRPQEAREAVTLFLAHHPGDPEAGNLLEAVEALREPAPGPEDEDDSLRDGPEDTQETLEMEVPDISTPTLAEVYFQQGQIQEAIDTYKQVVARNPDDLRSRDRLEELEALSSPPIPSEPEAAPPPPDKKEKLLAVLKAWRSGIREEVQRPASP